jgi:hypothetical protein
MVDLSLDFVTLMQPWLSRLSLHLFIQFTGLARSRIDDLRPCYWALTHSIASTVPVRCTTLPEPTAQNCVANDVAKTQS